MIDLFEHVESIHDGLVLELFTVVDSLLPKGIINHGQYVIDEGVIDFFLQLRAARSRFFKLRLANLLRHHVELIKVEVLVAAQNCLLHTVLNDILLRFAKNLGRQVFHLLVKVLERHYRCRQRCRRS